MRKTTEGPLHIEVTPMGKPRMTRRDVWAKRPVVVAYRAYGDELRLRLPGYELPPSLDIIFHLPMPPSWSAKKRQEMAGKPHQQKPDIDNLLKAFMDHLAEGDAHVYDVRARKHWSIRAE